MGFSRDSYAARIKNLRKSRGLTQEQLAEKMHVTSTYIVKIENGQRTGSIEFSVDLANCFGVSLDYLSYLNWKQNSEPDKWGKKPAILFLLHTGSQMYNEAEANGIGFHAPQKTLYHTVISGS